MSELDADFDPATQSLSAILAEREGIRDRLTLAKVAIDAARRCAELEGPSMQRHRDYQRKRQIVCLCRWCELARAIAAFDGAPA